MQVEIIKGQEAPQELIQKYESVLPEGLIEIWKNYGFAELLDGYLRVINPDDYQELLNETYFRADVSVPIFVTAFGDVLTLEKGRYIGMVKYKNGDFTILPTNFELFMKNIEDDYFLKKYLEIPQYTAAVERLGKLKHDECFGYAPLLGLGGSEKVENLSKVNTRVHIELISQLVGGIGM